MVKSKTSGKPIEQKNPTERSKDPLSQNILLVNDDHDFLEMMVAQFKRHGFLNIITATDGEDALQKLTSENADLVVSDISMPNIDGFQLCRIMRSGEFHNCDNIPIILLSAIYRDVIAEQLARDVGANAYIQAPYDEHRLIELAITCLDPDADDQQQWQILNSQGEVLVLDDDEDILKLVRAVLQEDAWNVTVTSKPEDAKEILMQGDCQIFLLDVQMPSISGLEMLRWAKENVPNVRLGTYIE